MVYKQFQALPQAWRETRLLRTEDLTQLESVRYAPLIFQEYIDSELELRVTVVGERLFAAAWNLKKCSYPYDVRMDAGTPCTKHVLDSDTAKALLRLVRCLGLIYAAIDVRLTREGEPVFLEVNPAGQFLYIEQLTGMPISDAVAAELLNETRSAR